MSRQISPVQCVLWLGLGLLVVIGFFSVLTFLTLPNGQEVRNEILIAIEDIGRILDEFLIFGNEAECIAHNGLFRLDRIPTDALQEYQQLVRFDNVRLPTNPNDPTRTHIIYFPAVPLAPPNGSGLGVDLPTLPGNVLDHTRFKAFQGSPYLVGFFFNVSYANVSRFSRLLSVTDRNVEDRGPENLEQRRVMTALTRERVVCRYSDRVLQFVNNVLDSWVIHQLPVLSSFKDHLLDFFLDIMLGDANHPAFVKDYFNDFLYFISLVDSNDVAAARTIRAHLQNKCVRDYFRSRILDVVDDDRSDTIVYNWIKVGLPLESVITEATHAIINFGPLVNAVDLLVTQSITPIPLTNGTFGFSFLRLFQLARAGKGQVFNPANGQPVLTPLYNGTAEQLEINVVREFIRIMLPDNIFVSTDTQSDCSRCVHTEARHIPQLIEIRAEYEKANLFNLTWSPAAPTSAGWVRATQIYGFYDPTRYLGFMANYSSNVCLNDTTLALLTESETFSQSPIDNETLLPPGERELIPVFKQPIYAGFGLGARRNPYEILIQYVLLKLFDRVQCLTFKDICTTNRSLCNSSPPPLIPLAPLKSAPDSLFVVQPIQPCPST